MVRKSNHEIFKRFNMYFTLPHDFAHLYATALYISKNSFDKHLVNQSLEFFELVKFRHFAGANHLLKFNEICSVLRKQHLKLIFIHPKPEVFNG